MSTYAYSDIYDCAVCNEALAYPVNEEGEALDGGDLICLTCVLSYVVDMRTGTLTRASEFIERLTAELEEARLTLAAEQGRPEGAPSAGWRAISLTGWELFVDGGRSAAVWRFVDGKGWGWWTERGRAGEAPTARAAMIAADASTPAPTPE